MPGTKINPVKANLGLRSDQFNYVQMILLAVIVGMLAALGNLGFRELIHLSGLLFRQLEWNALRISRGGIFRRLDSGSPCQRRRRHAPPRPFFSRRCARLRVLEFSGAGEPWQRAHQARMDFHQGRGRGNLARLRMVGGPRGAYRAGGRRNRIGGRAVPKTRSRACKGAGRRGRRRRYRDYLQRSDGRADVRAGNCPARPHRTRQPDPAHRSDDDCGGDLARGGRKRRRCFRSRNSS